MGVTAYRNARNRAWKWIVQNPLKTYEWNGQFEDVALLGLYQDLSRREACDVASLLLNNAGKHPQGVAQAEELLRFAEDQFVIWSPVKDVEGWFKVCP